MDPWFELDEDALRQYIDAKAVFEAWDSARAKAAEGREYLIRTGVDNKQKSLGGYAPKRPRTCTRGSSRARKPPKPG